MKEYFKSIDDSFKMYMDIVRGEDMSKKKKSYTWFKSIIDIKVIESNYDEVKLGITIKNKKKEPIITFPAEVLRNGDSLLIRDIYCYIKDT
jgi:hypothetical protein